MAWTAPRTYVAGEILTAVILNADIQANLVNLDQHAHSGAAGDGEQFLTSLDYADLDYQSALDAPISGHLRFWADSGGTLRYRANAGSEKTVTNTTHSHTQASGTGNSNTSTATAVTPESYGGNGRSITTTPSDSTGSPQYGIVLFGSVIFENTNGLSGTVFMNIEKGGSQLVEVSAGMPAPINTKVIPVISYFDIAPANSSTTYETDYKESGSTNTTYGVQTMATREVQCL